MPTLSLQIPEEFNQELSASLRTIYRQAIDQARQDAGMMRDFLTINEITESFLEVSRGTLKNWIANGLPTYQVEGKLYIKKAELYAYIEKHRQ